MAEKRLNLVYEECGLLRSEEIAFNLYQRREGDQALVFLGQTRRPDDSLSDASAEQVRPWIEEILDSTSVAIPDKGIYYAYSISDLQPELSDVRFERKKR